MHFNSLDQTKVDLEACIQFAATHFFKRVDASATAVAEVSSAPSEPSDSSSSLVQSPRLVLLLVDEVSKAGGHLAEGTNSSCILTSVGSLLDQQRKSEDGRPLVIVPVVSSLSQKLMDDHKTSSGRTIRLIPLPVSLVGVVNEMKELLGLSPEYHTLIEWLCSQVLLHGRMLEAIIAILSERAVKPTLRQILLTASTNPFQTLNLIQYQLSDHDLCKGLFDNWIPISSSLLEVVCNALLGRSVERGQIVSTDRTYDKLQECGFIVEDGGAAGGRITPIISALHLLIWAQNMHISHASLAQDSQLKLFLDAILRMFTVRSSHDWSEYERFHSGAFACNPESSFAIEGAQNRLFILKHILTHTHTHTLLRAHTIADVELLFRFCYNYFEIKSMSVLQFYKVDDQSRVSSSCLNAVMDLTCDLAFSQAPRTLPVTEALKVGSSVLSAPIAATIVELAAVGQEFYDIRIVQKLSASSASVCILQQCRWSDSADTADKKCQEWLGAKMIRMTGVLCVDLVYI